MTAISGTLIWTLCFLIILIATLVTVQRSYVRYKFSAEISRKIAHISVGLLALVFIRVIDDIWIIGMTSLITFFLLLFTRKRGRLDFIHKTDRRTMGSVVYPLPFFLCYIVAVREQNQLYLYLPLLTFILADPTAAIAGTGLKWKPYLVWNEIKTLSGSMAFFAATVLISLILVQASSGSGFMVRLGIMFLIALPATLVEALSPNGSDNFTVPLVQLMVIRLFLV